MSRPSSLFLRSFSSFFWTGLIDRRGPLPNPFINGILVKPPDPSNADRGDPAFRSILADGDFMELEVLGEFLSGHNVGHELGLQS
jgi:hypothetical protein